MSKLQAGNHKIVRYMASALFAGLLFVMLAGILGPLALRRLGVLPYENSGYAADEPDERIEPEIPAQEYPYEIQKLDDSYNPASASLYDRITALNRRLSGMVQTIETYCDEHVPGRPAMIEAYIWIQKALGSRVIDGDDVVVKMKNDQLTFLMDPLDENDMEACSGNLTEFAEFAAEQGAEFLYVQTPCKINKYDDQLPDGVEDGANGNADRLTDALKSAGVNVLDLRDEIVDAMNFDKAFYVTDHHWKPQTGLWAARTILGELNAEEGGDFDLANVQDDRYMVSVLVDSFLGALGKKTGIGYMGLDDFDVYKPAFETRFTMTIAASGAVYKGDFNQALINEKELETGDYFTKNPYAAYFRDDQALVHVKNEKAAETKKVLLLKDSFGLAVAPFMAVSVSDLDVIDLRHFDGSLKAYVKETKPDIIVVMYNPKAISAPAGYHADLFDFE